MEMNTVVAEALRSRQTQGGISNVIFVACGGSLAAFYPAKWLLERVSRKLRVGYYPANEFVHAAPATLDQNALVIACSHGGTTAETVAALGLAKERGAATVAFTYTPGSELTAYGDQVVQYEYGEGAVFSRKQNALGLQIAMELLHQLEGWADYAAAEQGFGRLDELVHRAQQQSMPAAEAFALANRDEQVIYTIGSGASWGAAYTECICILMEMQWIHSNCIHAGEFFHGPFEITDVDTPFLLLMGAGSTRPLDDRALQFLQQWGQKVYVVDAQALGIQAIPEPVQEYFAPLIFTLVLDVYNQQLAAVRQHPLSIRRYMGKVSY